MDRFLGSWYRGATVLATDPDEEILDLLGYILRDDGYRPVLYRQPADLTAIVRRVRPQAMVVGLPALKAAQSYLLDSLDRCPITTGVPAVLLSWPGRDNAPVRPSTALRVAGVVGRPFDLEQFSGMLRHAIAAPVRC